MLAPANSHQRTAHFYLKVLAHPAHALRVLVLKNSTSFERSSTMRRSLTKIELCRCGPFVRDSVAHQCIVSEAYTR
jgi:hypothetical protein